MTHAFCFHSNVSLSRHTPQWLAPRGIAISQLPRGDERAPHAGLSSQELAEDHLPKLAGDQPKNWRAPTRRLAGHRILVIGHSPTRPPSRALFVFVFLFLVARVFGYADTLETWMVVARKEPFLCGRRPGQPSSSALARRVCVQSWWLPVVLLLSFLAD